MKAAQRLGKNIRRVRLYRKLTQDQLCYKLGTDSSYLSNLESGNKNPTLSTIERIAMALDVSIEELMK